jgi:hypothetical protein
MGKSVDNVSDKRYVELSKKMERIRPFLKGVGSIFDISGTYFSKTKVTSGFRGDAKKIRTDWEVIAKDMRNAINLF